MIRKLFNRKRSAALVVALLLLVCLTVGGTLAFLIDSSGPVENTFTPANVPPTIVEELEGNVKEKVTIKNSGNIPAYIRAVVVVTWQDEDGNVYSSAPVLGTDYTATLPATNGWMQKNDGYYYYTSKVPAGEETTALLTDGAVKAEADIPNGYQLHMEIIAQSIQATPDQAVIDAWGFVPGA